MNANENVGLSVSPAGPASTASVMRGGHSAPSSSSRSSRSSRTNSALPDDRPEDAPLGVLRAGFERTGTPSWIMRVIREQGYDHAEGFRLDLALTGDGYRGARQATVPSLLEGAVDLIDTDWISIGRLRGEGAPVAAFHPYGRIMGGLVADRARGLAGPEDLAGRRIAVVNRFDKTWLVLRAWSLAAGLPDPAERVELVETGAKQEALSLLQSGAVDGAVLFWHLSVEAVLDPRFVLAFDALDAVESLAGAPLPTTFFIATDTLRRERPELLRAFARAYEAAVAAMRADAALWRSGAGEAATATTAEPLRAAWCRRIGLAWPDQLPDRLGACFATLRGWLGGAALGLERVPPGTFDRSFLEPILDPILAPTEVTP